MPRGAWSAKDERQYEHVKESEQQRGRPIDKAKEIAARTVNKERREEGRMPNVRTQGTGNPTTSLDSRSRDELYNIAKQRGIAGRSHMLKSELIQALRKR